MKNFVLVALTCIVALPIGIAAGLHSNSPHSTNPAAWRVTLYSHGEPSQTWVTSDEPQLARGHWWFSDKHGDDVAISGTVSIEAHREGEKQPTPAPPSSLPKKPGNTGSK